MQNSGFIQSPFGGMFMSNSNTSNGNVANFQQTFSSSSSSTLGGGMSSSTRTSIVNGISTTISSKTDQYGNTTTETTVNDGRGNVSRRIQ